MIRHSAREVVVAVLAVALTASATHAADSCGGGCPKLPSATRSVSSNLVPRPAAPAVLLTATLKKAHKKQLIKVDAVMTTSVYTPGLGSTLMLFADVNGLAMQPSAAANPTVVDCGGLGGPPPSFACTVSASWWLDTDDPANIALVTTPLPPVVVTLHGGEMVGAAVGAPIDISMTVRMVKK